jgi:hypothetical protein
MDTPPTQVEFQREEGRVRVTFTPGLTIDQWAQTLALNRPMTRAEFEQAARELGSEWGVEVVIEAAG